MGPCFGADILGACFPPLFMHLCRHRNRIGTPHFILTLRLLFSYFPESYTYCFSPVPEGLSLHQLESNFVFGTHRQDTTFTRRSPQVMAVLEIDSQMTSHTPLNIAGDGLIRLNDVTAVLPGRNEIFLSEERDEFDRKLVRPAQRPALRAACGRNTLDRAQEWLSVEHITPDRCSLLLWLADSAALGCGYMQGNNHGQV